MSLQSQLWEIICKSATKWILKIENIGDIKKMTVRGHIK